MSGEVSPQVSCSEIVIRKNERTGSKPIVIENTSETFKTVSSIMVPRIYFQFITSGFQRVTNLCQGRQFVGERRQLTRSDPLKERTFSRRTREKPLPTCALRLAGLEDGLASSTATRWEMGVGPAKVGASVDGAGSKQSILVVVVVSHPPQDDFFRPVLWAKWSRA